MSFIENNSAASVGNETSPKLGSCGPVSIHASDQFIAVEAPQGSQRKQSSESARLPFKSKSESGQKGDGSFCLPRVVVDALINQHASAYEICTLLCLACFTESSGIYSYAGHSGVNKHTGANKAKGGPILAAIQSLKERRVYKKVKQGRGAPKLVDIGPLLLDRETWHEKFCGPLPDQEHAYGKVKHILPTFGEQLVDRVWFGKNLVTGFGEFKQPLKALLRAGDVAARLLLSMYAANDMSGWGGVRPYSSANPVLSSGLITRVYEPVHGGSIKLRGGAKIYKARETSGAQINAAIIKRICKQSGDASEQDVFSKAFKSLISIGLIYEVVIALDRNSSADGSIAKGAQPMHELDTRTQHGFKPDGEHGVGWLTAMTCDELGSSLSDESSRFNGTYASIIPEWQDVMLIGLMRVRFRVTNPKNAEVSDAIKRIAEGNRDAFKFINQVRKENGLEEQKLPKHVTL